MSKERELLERALQLISDAYEGMIATKLCNDIQELLAQPEPEPVAWMYDHIIKDGHEKQVIFDMVDTCARNLESDNCINIRPLYASPPKREPSASAREMYQRGYADGFRAIEKAHGIGE